jgi:hypothetical protein
VKRQHALLAASIVLATAGSVSTALAGPEVRRVVVAGPADDTIATRVQKELTALGFETVRVGALDGCARSAVVVAARDNEATAATCSDGDQVGIWVAEGGSLRLRDVVVVHEEGDPARETTAVRAAEVTRATIAMHDAEEEAAQAKPPPPPPKPKPQTQPEGWETFDRPTPAPSAKPAQTNRAPTFLLSTGISGLLGVDASAAAFSAKTEIGVLRHLTAAARLEYPLESPNLGGGTALSVAPAFAGAGVGVPLSGPDTFIIPRFGAGVGVAWVRATRPAGLLDFRLPTSSETSDSTASFAFYGDVGLSMRLYRALRLTADGVLGASTSRLVVRDRGTHVAYWGQPFGALALRLELMFK